jgi:hypothetical protein
MGNFKCSHISRQEQVENGDNNFLKKFENS